MSPFLIFKSEMISDGFPFADTPERLIWFMNHFNNIAMVRKTNKTLQALIEKNNQLVIQYVDALEKINKEGEKRIRKADEVLNKYQNGNLSKKIADNQIKKLVGHSIDDYLKLHDHYKIFGEEQQDEEEDSAINNFDFMASPEARMEQMKMFSTLSIPSKHPGELISKLTHLFTLPKIWEN